MIFNKRICDDDDDDDDDNDDEEEEAPLLSSKKLLQFCSKNDQKLIGLSLNSKDMDMNSYVHRKVLKPSWLLSMEAWLRGLYGP